MQSLAEQDVCFREAAKNWLAKAQTRSRRPISESSVPTIQSALDNYILPVVGDLPLSKVHNGTCKPIVDAMKKEGLSSSSMDSYFKIVKNVMKSIIDPETGDYVFHRKWSPELLDMPLVEHTKTPCATKEQIEKMLKYSKDEWERRLYVVLAATGLRISEALALEWSHLTNDGRTLSIVQKVNRRGKIVRRMKTKAGTRQVDLSAEVAKFLAGTVRESDSPLMFPTREGTPHLPNNIERRRLREHVTGSWHQFRRFRETHLSKMSCNHDLRLIWLGHQPETMSEIYTKLKGDVDFRLKEAERVGIGFQIVPLAPYAERAVYGSRGIRKRRVDALPYPIRRVAVKRQSS